MVVLLASAFGAVLLLGVVLGIWLERAANRRSKGGTLDFTPFAGVDLGLRSAMVTTSGGRSYGLCGGGMHFYGGGDRCQCGMNPTSLSTS